jgi:hypothetical protein
MQYSIIRSRAGLVALVFALIISLVSAVPVPAKESGLSSPSINGRGHIQHDLAKISMLPAATTSFIQGHSSPDLDDQLVRRSIGSKIKHAFQKVGHAIKKGFQKAGAAIKHVAQKVGSGIKTAAKKVGHFIKTTGAKVAKFGLKVVQSVGEVVGKVAQFIPAIGKPIQQAIHGVSKVAGVISDHIHAKLSSKLQKGMNVMNKANKIMDYIPREFSEEEAFQERDIGDAYYFEERDDIALENREDSYFEAYERDIYEGYDLD